MVDIHIKNILYIENTKNIKNITLF